MTIQQALIEYPYIAERIQQIRQGLSIMIETRHEPVVTAKISAMPSGGSISNPTMDQVFNMDSRLNRNIKQAMDDIEELLDAKEMVDQGLKLLNTQERQIIELRYFKQPRMSWKQIRKAIGYSESQSHRNHIDALEKMRIVKDDSKCVDMGVNASV